MRVCGVLGLPFARPGVNFTSRAAPSLSTAIHKNLGSLRCCRGTVAAMDH
jgi:hypothetical protein